MADQYEELRLQVNLQDNASTGLVALKKQLDELSRSGIAERFRDQASIFERSMKALGVEATGAAKSLKELAGQYSGLLGGAVAVGFASYKIQENFRNLTGEINETRIAAEELGIAYSELHHINEELSKSGYSVAESTKLAAQVENAMYEARKHRVSQMFQDLITMTARPDIMLTFRKELAESKDTADGIAAFLRMNKAASDSIAKNNVDADKHRIATDSARARERLNQAAGVTIDLNRVRDIGKETEEEKARNEALAASVKTLNEQWAATEVNLTRIRDVILLPIISEGSVFSNFVKGGAKTTDEIATKMEAWQAGLKGSFWDFFKIPPGIQALVDRLLGISNKGMGGGPQGGAPFGKGGPPFGKEGFKSPPTSPVQTHDMLGPVTKGPELVAPPLKSDLGNDIGINAPILNQKNQNRKWGPMDLMPGSDMLRFSGGGGDQLGYPWNQMRKSTNIEDRRAEGEEFMKRREENTKLLIQVNDRLFALLQPQGDTQSPAFRGLGGLPGLGGRAGPGYGRGPSAAPSAAPSVGPSGTRDRGTGPNVTAPLGPPPAGGPLTPEGMALLDTIATREAEPAFKDNKRAGWDVGVGGKSLDVSNPPVNKPGATYSYHGETIDIGGVEMHPHHQYPGWGGFRGGAGTSFAFGRYQETVLTYYENVRRSQKLHPGMKVDGWSPEAQNIRNWDKAQEVYRRNYSKTGVQDLTGDLQKDLEANKGNPEAIGRMSGALSGEWTSAPGGREGSKVTGGKVQYYGATFQKMLEAQTKVPATAKGAPGGGLGQLGRAAASPSPVGDATLQENVKFLEERGGHSEINRKSGPIGATGQINPEFIARMVAAGKDYEKETGKKAVFGEFDRDYATQQYYRSEYLRTHQGLAAPAGTSRHEHAERGAGDLPTSDFRTWMEANREKYGIEGLPGHAGVVDRPHQQMSRIYKGPSFYHPTAATAKSPADQAPTTAPSTNRGVAILPQGIEARYGGHDPKEVAQSLRDIALGEGFSDTIVISGAGTPEEETAAVVAALNRGDVTGAIGFSRGANVLEKVLKDPKVDPKLKERIKEVVLIGRTRKYTTGKIPGIKTIDIPEIAGKTHMELPGEVARKVKEEVERRKARDTIDSDAKKSNGVGKSKVSGKLTVDVEAPAGTRVHAVGTGPFEKPTIQRRHRPLISPEPVVAPSNLG